MYYLFEHHVMCLIVDVNCKQRKKSTFDGKQNSEMLCQGEVDVVVSAPLVEVRSGVAGEIGVVGGADVVSETVVHGFELTLTLNDDALD